MKASNVTIITRPAQLMIFAPLFMIFYWAVLYMLFSREAFSPEFMVSSVMISVGLMLIGLEFFSEPEIARVEVDKIVFNARKPIPFSEIESFAFDDGFKLKERSGFWVLLFQSPNKNGDGHARFLEDFKTALSEWKDQNLGTCQAMPQQTYFYGTWKAKISGVAIGVAYACLVALALRLGVGYINVLVITPTFIFFAVLFFFGKRCE